MVQSFVLSPVLTAFASDLLYNAISTVLRKRTANNKQASIHLPCKLR
jgi:hypothetical protein